MLIQRPFSNLFPPFFWDGGTLGVPGGGRGEGAWGKRETGFFTLVILTPW
jgi:hypothetical protein